MVGVGPKDVLDAAGVSVKSELPGVGQHLMDHLVSYSFLSFLNFSIKNSLVHSRYTGLDPSLLIRLLRTLFSVILYPRHVLIILSRKLPAAAGSSASSLLPSQHSEVDIVTLRQGIKLAQTVGSQRLKGVS